jgi:hypothetical protein
MLFIAGVIITFAALVVFPRVRIRGATADHLGWMSEQWLIEQRRSHSR